MRKSPNYLPDQINITWTVSDIKERDEIGALTVDECRIILEILADNHDANIGINWEIIDLEIENFYSEKYNNKE